MGTTARSWMAGAVGALLATAGCAPLGNDGCTSDAQCKLGRVCAEGLCIDPSVAAPATDVVSGVAGQGAPVPEPMPSAPSDGTAMEDPSDSSLTDAVGTGSPMDAAVETTTDATPARDVSGVEFLCTPEGPGACQNATDCPIIEDGSGKEVAKQCGIECATSLVAGCAEQCILARTTITQPCASCLGAFFDCILTTCLAPCISGSEQDCTTCSRTRPLGNTCSDQWYACSGTELNPEYEGG